MKKNRISYLVFLLLLSYLLFYGFGCSVVYFYHVSNQSDKDIKVLYISVYEQKSDTIKRLILEPGTSFLIESTSNGIPWHQENDTVYGGMELIITQDSIITTKDHRRGTNWESDSKKNLTFTVRDEDF